MQTVEEEKKELGFFVTKGDKLKKKDKNIKSERKSAGIPEALILHRFYKNRCCNSFSKTVSQTRI